MHLDEENTWAVLRQLDDPVYTAWPRGYDHDATRERYERLAARLGERFACTAEVDRDVQDASHHGRIRIPQSATDGGRQLVVSISNFGSLAAVTFAYGGPAENAAEERASTRTTDRRRADEELDALGYVTLAQHLLGARYDGVSSLVDYDFTTWWTRYFDYV